MSLSHYFQNYVQQDAKWVWGKGDVPGQKRKKKKNQLKATNCNLPRDVECILAC